MNEIGSKKKDEKQDNLGEILTFFVSGKLFGVWPKDLLEIVEETEYIPVPNAPDFVCGVINSHGRVVTVTDITKILRNENLALGAKRRVAIINDEEFMVGMLVPADLQISFYDIGKEEIKQDKIMQFYQNCRLTFLKEDFEILVLERESLLTYLRDYFKTKSLA